MVVSRSVVAVACFCLASIAGITRAKSELMRHPHVAPQSDFAPLDAPVGGASAPAAGVRPASLAGSTIAVFAGDTLVVDGDSGKLVRVGDDATVRAELDIGPSVSQLVIDEPRARAFVADRAGDRIVVVDLRDGLRQVDTISTHAEPFGVALVPGGETLLVTTVADHRLTAYATSTGSRRFSVQLGPDPRGIAIRPDGSEAMVTFLTTGVVGRVDLTASRGVPTVDYVSIDPPVRIPDRSVQFQLPQAQAVANASERGTDAVVDNPDEGKRFARNAFAALYVGDDIAVVPHQVSTPHLPTEGVEVSSGGYGGGNGFEAPVTHRLAFVATPDRGESAGTRTAFASTSVHQPRALAYDGRTDTLYVAGYGSDDVLALAEVSQASVHAAWRTALPSDDGACGPDGITVDPDDGQLVVFCSLTREVVRLSAPSTNASAPATVVARTDALTGSRLSASARRGRALFRRGGDPRISTAGAMACASCHAEGRTDGLSWFLQGDLLQTPLLAGRLVGSHPFKWDGKDADLGQSLTNTVSRLGGMGITREQATDLQAFLTTLDPPRAPTVARPAAVARGKKLFESDRTGCAKCHYGPLLTDQKRHPLAADLDGVDTPSLVGLAQSAPYYHDGSARTLTALLRGNGSIHGMGRISRLDDREIGDLVAYLTTL